MNCRTAVMTVLAIFCTVASYAQNISGLQNKRLISADDLGSTVESLIGRLGGKIEGNIDSVVVLSDSEKELKVRIYYNGYINCFFTVSTMTESRQRERQVIPAQFSNVSSPSPAEVSLKLDDKVTSDQIPASPFLRIDISKKEGSTGKVKIFQLRKKWETTVAPGNVLINIRPQPIGVAATLNYNVKPASDVMPAKTITFGQQSLYQKTDFNRRIRTSRIGNSNEWFNYTGLPADISGTWNNIDANTTGLTRIVVTGNSAQVFYKCSPKDCELGKLSLASTTPNTYTTNLTRRTGLAETKTELTLQLSGNDLQVQHKEITKVGFSQSSKNRSYTFRRQQIKYLEPKILYLSDFAIVNTPTSGQSTTASGADKTMFNIWNEITVDNQVNFSNPQEISNVSINLFADKNPYSNTYYYIPADYHLRWDPVPPPKQPEEGYTFNILYGSQPGGGAEPDADAPVRMSAKLTAGISNAELSSIKAMLKAINPNFKNLLPLPLRENAITTFQNTLNAQFGVPMDRITVTTSTDLNNDISLAWRTNPDTKEFIQTALTSGEGISASVILKPMNEDIVDQQINASISLSDTRSLGKMILEPNAWRTRNWKNATPYPLQLKYLHVMKKANPGNKLIVYSWSMNDAVIPSQAQVAIDPGTVPPWLDSDPTALMWLAYNVVDCGECDTRVMESVTGGVFGSTTQQIKITIAPAVFDTLKASYFLVYVRSKQADPKGETVKELDALKVTNDGAKEFFVGPLFITPGGQLEFEYKITAASTDGDFYPSEQWIKASAKEVLLGKTFMKDMFRNIIPGLN